MVSSSIYTCLLVIQYGLLFKTQKLVLLAESLKALNQNFPFPYVVQVLEFDQFYQRSAYG